MALGAAVVFSLASFPAGAEILGQQSATIPGGGVITQAFQLNLNASVTVTTNPGLGAAFASFDDCERARTQGTPIPSVIGNQVSKSGSLTMAMAPGRYCVLVVNAGSEPVQASLTVSADRR